MSGQYATMYRRAREALEMDAEIRLERPLTPRERNLFRNCGTLTMLDSLGMIIYSAENAQELEHKLATTSMDSRFALARQEFLDRLSKFLDRPIRDTEQQQLAALRNIEEIWALEEQLHAAAPAEREAALHMLLTDVGK
jgi:hypothetical protein